MMIGGGGGFVDCRVPQRREGNGLVDSGYTSQVLPIP